MKIINNKIILLLTSSIFLFIAANDNGFKSIFPLGFFTILRFFICFVMFYFVYKKYKEDNSIDSLWIWVFGLIGILFNPFIEIIFKRKVWSLIDLLVGIFFILYVLFFEIKNKKEVFNNIKNKISKKFIKNKFLILFFLVLLFFIFIIQKIDNNKYKINNDKVLDMSKQEPLPLNEITTDNKIIKNSENKNMENKTYTEAVLNTSLGKITIELSKDKPLTTGNFLKLAENGFYNGIKFHRVIKGFMIQTGDPLSKDDTKKAYWGTGGPGYKFADELTGTETYSIGTVAMANSGPNTNGSQFFIMTSNTNLPPAYTVFGKVLSGQEVAQEIENTKTDASDKPLEDIIINSIELK